MWTYEQTRQQNGFTLIELLIVIVLLALLSASAALMVRVPLKKAQQQQSLAQLKMFDAMARQRARQGDLLRLELNIDDTVASLVDERQNTTTMSTILNVNKNEIKTAGMTKNDASRYTIHYDQFGTSASYGVRLGSENRNYRWLVVLGMTGQTYFAANRETVDAIIATERNYAD